MNDNDIVKAGSADENSEEDILELEDFEFDVEKVSSSNPLKDDTPNDKKVSGSPETKTAAPLEKPEEQTESSAGDKIIEPDPFAGKSPVFRELAQPKLPELAQENRAYLQIQSPSRVFFYWSIKNNSFETLQKALGNRAENYGLAVKLVNLTANREQIAPVESSGSWWFDAAPDSAYRAEIGFYTPNRPFVRIIFSNTLETPRSAPSPNTDYSEYFTVTPDQFAEVLDSAGFSQDAFDVYVAGDYPEFADEATRMAFARIAEIEDVDFSEISLYELRYVLFALASGVTLVALRETLSGDLWKFLARLTDEKTGALSEEKVISALEEFFGFSPFLEETDEEFTLAPVFGASRVNFPKDLKNRKFSFSPGKRRLLDNRLAPLSSGSISSLFDTKLSSFSKKFPLFTTRGSENLSLLHTAADFCARQMFGVEMMTGGIWSDKGQNGEMKFKAMDGTPILVYGRTGLTVRTAKTFSVYNDATSFSMSALGSLGIGGGGGMSKGIYEYYNDRVKKREFTNRTYTASDADQYNPVTPNGVMQLISNFKSIQIHETGNALSRIAGRSERAANWTDPSSGITYWFGKLPPQQDALNVNAYDWDTGQAFELKVLLKYRQLMGIK